MYFIVAISESRSSFLWKFSKNCLLTLRVLIIALKWNCWWPYMAADFKSIQSSFSVIIKRKQNQLTFKIYLFKWIAVHGVDLNDKLIRLFFWTFKLEWTKWQVVNTLRQKVRFWIHYKFISNKPFMCDLCLLILL